MINAFSRRLGQRLGKLFPSAPVRQEALGNFVECGRSFPHCCSRMNFTVNYVTSLLGTNVDDSPELETVIHHGSLNNEQLKSSSSYIRKYI